MVGRAERRRRAERSRRRRERVLRICVQDQVLPYYAGVGLCGNRGCSCCTTIRSMRRVESRKQRYAGRRACMCEWEE